MLDNNALVAAATLVFFALIGLEIWVAHRRRLRTYGLADSLASMGCGVWTVTVEVFTKAATLLLYAFVADRYALLHFDRARCVVHLGAVLRRPRFPLLLGASLVA